MSRRDSLSKAGKKDAATRDVQAKLDTASNKLAKAMALAAQTESKLKEIKGKDQQGEEGNSVQYNAAERFKQGIASLAEKKDVVSFKSLKNWRKLRKTIFETTSPQVFEGEIEKLVRGSPQDNEENSDLQQSTNFEFNDPEFGPSEKDSSGFKSIGVKLSENTSNLHWPRISQIADMGKATFIDNAGDLEALGSSFWIKNIIQGEFGGLNFLNALVLAVSHWDLFRKIFHPSFERHFKHGIYSFKFFKNNNQSYFVIVDDKIPSIQQEDGEYIPWGARSKNASEYWVSLIEKAYAKLHMSYENMSSEHLKFHDHFYSLTGLMAEEINLDSELLDLSLLWELLTNFKKYNLPMGCLFDKDEAETSIPIANGHIYIIMDLYTTEEGRCIVRIGDPWTNSTPLIDDQENLGEYEISFDVFKESFNKLILAKDFPETWKGLKFDCEILSSKGGPTHANNLWVENPQYMFEVTAKVEGNMIIRLHRYLGIQSLQSENLGSTFGFALISLLSTETKVKTPDYKRIITIIKSNEGDSFALTNLRLAKGRYTLIPFTMEKGETNFFYCELFFDFKENLIEFSFKQTEKILEPSLGTNIPALKPRTLKQTLRLSDFEGIHLNEVQDNVMLLIPHTTSKILYKEGVTPKFGNPKTLRKDLSYSNTSKSNNTKRLYDAKLDGQQEYELDACLLGLGAEGAPNQDIDHDILATLEDVIDFDDYGLTDVGLEALIDVIVQNKSIRVLKLAGNQLTDAIVLRLYDKLELSHHFELEELDLSNNNLGKQSGDILLGMINSFKNLVKIDVSGNKNLPGNLKNSIDFNLSKKSTTNKANTKHF